MIEFWGRSEAGVGGAGGHTLGQDKQLVKYLEYGNFEEGEKISDVILADFIKHENYTKSLQKFWGGLFSISL